MSRAALVVVPLLLASATAHAQGLDVDRWLDKTGVQLLAVEFYATWCKPCMKAVPKWKALQEKYRRRGFRLVVVSVQDPKGGCFNPGWNPDAVICDDDGRIARRFGAADKLPAAFLWNWRGELLSNHAKVEAVEAQVKAHFRDNPLVRVVVQDVARGSGLGHTQLRRLIKDALKRRNKLQVALSKTQQARIQKLRKQAPAGKECGRQTLTPNSELEASTRRVQGRHRLQLGLLSAERGCMVAATAVDFDPKHPDQSVAEALDELMGRLRPEVQLPFSVRASAPRPKSDKIGERSEDRDWNPENEEMTIVRFSSTPPGAVVMLDGKLICQDTSKGCDRTVSVGRHSLSMQKEGYLERSETVSIRKGKNVQWTLERNVARLSVTSKPAGLDVKVGGRVVGKTPLSGFELEPGVHEVLVASPCHYDTGKRMTLVRGKQHKLHETPKPRMGAIRVTANAGKNAVAADVFVDDAKVGQTPGVFKVTTCTKKVEVKHQKYGGWTKDVTVKERKTLDLAVRFHPDGAVKGEAKLQWHFSQSAKVDFTESEVTVAQYAACIRSGVCGPKTYRTKRNEDTCNVGYADRGGHPMNCVSWYGADTFCRWAGGRLPTKDEWVAEVSHSELAKFPDGVTCKTAVVDGGDDGCGKGRTWPVCSKPAGNSESGLCDMIGNVGEWTRTVESNERAVMGGSWVMAGYVMRDNTYGITLEPRDRGPSIGFRCARP